MHTSIQRVHTYRPLWSLLLSTGACSMHKSIHTCTYIQTAVGLLIQYNENSGQESTMSTNFQYGITILLLVMNGTLIFIPVVLIIHTMLLDLGLPECLKFCRTCADDDGIRNIYVCVRERECVCVCVSVHICTCLNIYAYTNVSNSATCADDDGIRNICVCV
jgi:hypothetical protein